MDHPEIDREYSFVRVLDGKVECAAYTRFSDGSACVSGTEDERIYEERDDAWQLALDWLKSEGFITREEAIEKSLIPAD
jgi:hypothetical protein